MPLSPTVQSREPFDGEDDAVLPVIDRWFGSWRISLHRRAYSPAELTETYDNHAARWDRITGAFGVDTAYANALRKVQRRGDLSLCTQNEYILDCGAGDGAFAAAVAQTMPAQIIAVDLSPQMLACAEQRLTRLNVDAQYRLADARCLPFPDDSFDLVVTAHMLEHLPRPEQALREISRVLKPGGSVIASITRPSFIGRLIQLTWRTHALARCEGEQLLRDQGFEAVWSLPSTGNRIFDCFSVIYAARKPTVS